MDRLKLPAEYFRQLKCPMTALEGLSLIAAIQLASRHPKWIGPSRDIVMAYVDRLQPLVEEILPQHAALIKMGWNPDFDIE